MSEHGHDVELRLSRGRPPGLAVGVLAGGLVGSVLVARTAPGLAVVTAVAVVVVAFLVPFAISRRATVIQGDLVTSWGVRGPSAARSVSLSRLADVRYLPGGGRGPARLRLRDDGGRLSIPLPATGPARTQLLRTVADAASRRGLPIDQRTRSRLGMDLG